jgi:hypothetical protein
MYVQGFSVRRRRVFGDGLGSFRDSVSGEFTGEEELDGSLDLTR